MREAIDRCIEALRHATRLRSRAPEVIATFSQELRAYRGHVLEPVADPPEIAARHRTGDFSDPGGPAPVARARPHAGVFTDA